jgi:hypothetical protein
MDTRTGKKNWVHSGTSAFLARSNVSPDDQRLYVIQSVDGRILSFNQLTGELNWLVSCDQFEEDCANSVYADFEISYTGEYLIYGDILGRIVALKLGFMLEDFEPTAAPGVDIVDASDNEIWPETSGTNGDNSPSSAALGVIIFLIVLVAIVTTASLSYILFMNSLKTAPHPMQEQHPPDDEPNTTWDYSLPLDLDFAPDKYEDTIISQHKFNLQVEPEFQIPVTPSKGFGRKTLDGQFESMGPIPADRLSLLLGTSSRIAPIREDYSYGALVLV